jgi:hypothetical protein
MPAHSQARGSAVPKAPKKKANGGRPLGKAALRALGKNAEAVNSVLNLLESGESLKTHHFALAQIVRPSGAGWMIASFMGETEEVNLPIKGAVRFKGRSANKADRANCMTPGDIVVVEGAYIAAKVSRVASFIIRLHLERLRIPFPKKFFDSAAGAAEEASEEEDWDWERDEEAEEAEAKEEAARRAEEMRAYRIRHGLPPTAEVDEDAVAVEAAREEEEEEEPLEAAIPAAAGGGGKAGPNRAERRAAAAAAASATVAEEERRAFLLRASLSAAVEDGAISRHPPLERGVRTSAPRAEGRLSKDAWIDSI